jgi:hypothetical protein
MPDRTLKFSDVARSISTRGHQTDTLQYASSGRFPIVDQSAALVAGYSEDEEKVLRVGPVVVFGDHTRTVKFVDFPFVVGADGTKLLQPANEEISVRFLAYLTEFAAQQIPNLGYSRHFKELKEVLVRVPTRDEQDRIVGILMTWEASIYAVSRLREARGEAVTGEGCRLLRLQSAEQPCGWRDGTIGEVVADITTGVSVNAEDRPRAENEIGVLKTSSVLTGIFEPQQHKAVLAVEAHRAAAPVTGDTVLVSRMNTPDLVGRSAYVPGSYPDIYLPDRLWQVRTKPGFSARWLAAVIGNAAFRPRLASITAGTSGSMKNISQSGFLSLSLPIPPPATREQLARVFDAFEREIVLLQQQEEHLRMQKAALLSRLLSGKLLVPRITPEANGMEAAHA